jgi:hypothetical protein
VYAVRNLPRISDVRVVCAFYFPDVPQRVKQCKIYVPKAYLPVGIEKFWAIVEADGLASRLKIRGYLPVRELVSNTAQETKQPSSSNPGPGPGPDPDAAAADVESDHASSVTLVSAGTQVGPETSDKAWTDLLCIDTSVLLLNPGAAELTTLGAQAWHISNRYLGKASPKVCI